ncbi:unnamed protein product [Orchesella dallaii]|uniref:Diacylglycerol O-acyltransferase n=1 Tax=Orchesella dallaii TaxID=48710 RepID=A0ABP1PUT1_9HEXA
MSQLSQKIVNFLNKILLILLTILTIFVGYPIILFIFLPIWIYRYVLEYIVPKLDSRFSHILKGMGALFSAHTPYTKPTSVVITNFYLETPLDKNKFINIFNSKVFPLQNKNGSPVYRELKQRIVQKFGYNFWYDVDKFHLSDHIKLLHEYENEPERSVTQLEIEKLAYKLTTRPFHPDRSPWELIIVNNLTHDNDPLIKSVLITRFHHCLADGVSLIKLLERVGLKPWKDPFSSSLKVNKLGCFTRMILIPLRLLIEGPYQAIKLIKFSNDDNDWMKIVLSKPTGFKRIKDTDFIPISTLKAIKNRNSHENLNIGSIIVALVVHATVEAMKRRNVKGNFSKLHVTLPWPLPNHPDGVCNHWTVVKIPVLVDPNDILQTVCNVAREFEKLKHSIQPLVLDAIANLSGSLPTPWIPKMDSLLTSTCIMSNVAGPVEAVDIAGCTVRRITVAGSTAPGYAVGSLCLSYNGQIRITIGGDICNLNQSDDAVFLANSCEKIVQELAQRMS